MVTAIKKILKYLRGALEEGIEFSEQREREFQVLYQELLKHDENKDHSIPNLEDFHTVHSFGDASFGTSITMRSISGVVIYYRSCPVLWKSNTQTVMSKSTTEAEFIATADTIAMSESNEHK